MTQDATPMLNVSNLTVGFGGLKAVKSLSFQVPPATIGALVGPNGAGKSTVVNALSGFVRIDGDFQLDGRSLVGLLPSQIAAAGIARTFQNIRLFGSMTVLETLVTGAHTTLRSGFLSLLVRNATARREEVDVLRRAEEMLDIVGLPRNMMGRTATTLSYGQQRRVEIARALMSQPKLLLLDEPIAGMNVSEKQEVGNLVLKLRSNGMTVLLVEHDMQVIRRLADHVTVLFHGETLADGRPAEVLADDRVKAAYLGRKAA